MNLGSDLRLASPSAVFLPHSLWYTSLPPGSGWNAASLPSQHAVQNLWSFAETARSIASCWGSEDLIQNDIKWLPSSLNRSRFSKCVKDVFATFRISGCTLGFNDLIQIAVINLDCISSHVPLMWVLSKNSLITVDLESTEFAQFDSTFNIIQRCSTLLGFAALRWDRRRCHWSRFFRVLICGFQCLRWQTQFPVEFRWPSGLCDFMMIQAGQ